MNELELLEQLVMRGRRPAMSDRETYPMADPLANPEPMGSVPFLKSAPIKKEAETLVVAPPVSEAKILPKLEKEFHGVDAPTSRYGEAMRQWVNPALQMQIEAIPGRDEEAEVKARSEEARQKFLSRASQALPMFTADTSEEEAALREVRGKRDQAGEYPQRDLLTEAIYALGPGLLGSVTGTAGQAAALPAFKSSMEYRNTMRKEDIDAFKAAKEKLSDMEKGLNQRIKDKNDVAYKQTRNLLDWGKAQLDALQLDMTKTAEQKSELSKLIAKAIGDATSGTTKAAERIAEFDQRTDEFDREMDLKEKEQREAPKGARKGPAPKIPWTQDPSKVTAAIPSGYFGAEATHDGRTAISQKDAEMVRGAVGDMGKMRDAVRELIRVLPDSPRGMTAQKWTEIQSKARSAETIYRGKSFADLGVPSHNDQAILSAVIAAPSTSEGWQGFYKAFNPRQAKKLLDGFIRDQGNQVGIKLEPYGVRLKGSSGASSGAQGSAKETKVVNGVTYEKAPGGWKRVK